MSYKFNPATLSLVHLKYFCDAVKLGGVSAAAKANFVTQSAISQGIGKLEDSLDVHLVAKHPNRFKPTPEGERVFQQGSLLLQQAAGFLMDCAEEPMGDLEFASTHSLAVSIVPGYLKQFKEANPAVAVTFYTGGKERIKQLLKTGRIDFGLVADEGDLTDFDSRTLFCGAFGMYAATHLSEEEERQLGFIVAEGDCKEMLFLKEAYANAHRKAPPICLRASSWEIIAQFAAAGLGIGYIPDYIAKSKGHALKSCDRGIAPFSYRVSAISPRGCRLRKSSEVFLTMNSWMDSLDHFRVCGSGIG